MSVINVNFHNNDENGTLTENESSDVNNLVHYLPCSIKFDGEASISSHFSNFIECDERNSKDYKASFRGYPLRGAIQEAPSQYSFAVMKETKKDEDEHRNISQQKVFNKFMLWNVSEKPFPGDHFHQAMKWVNLANVIHKK